MLAVGDSTQLEIIFATKVYKNRISKRPRIQTNEGPPDKHVQIISYVVARPDSTYPVVINPYKLDMSQWGDKTQNEVKFNIENVSDAELSLTLVSHYWKYFTVELPKSIGAGETAEGTVILTDEGANESFEKSFTFEVNDQQTSRFTVPVKRSLRPGMKQQTAASTGAKKAGH